VAALEFVQLSMSITPDTPDLPEILSRIIPAIKNHNLMPTRLCSSD